MRSLFLLKFVESDMLCLPSEHWHLTSRDQLVFERLFWGINFHWKDFNCKEELGTTKNQLYKIAAL